jgi:hypothetical protein
MLAKQRKLRRQEDIREGRKPKKEDAELDEIYKALHSD